MSPRSTRRYGSRRLAVALAGVAVFALGAAVGCYQLPAHPVFGYEQDDISCTDYIDNDYDGLVDCADPDCLILSNLCGEQVPELPHEEPENTLQTCTDKIDNDDDGQFDCGDRECRDIPETCCLREFTNETCSDGIDNDGNGFADCADFGCRSGIFVSICTEDSNVSCEDGDDNDGDGLVDCDDEDCEGTDACQGETGGTPLPTENTLEACMDGFDNDKNGFTDCLDFSCCDPENDAMPPAEVVDYCLNSASEKTLEACTDGIDNDGDSFIDCEDFSCNGDNLDGACDPTDACRPCTPEAIDYCASLPGESTLAECTDGVDNDQNGFIDCADFSCNRLEQDLSNQEAYDYCFDLLENTFDKCSDGFDNDQNGFTDCADFSCSQASDLEVRQACQESLSASPDNTPNDRCADGLDNDGDGFIDCEDWDCSYDPLVTICGAGLCEP